MFGRHHTWESAAPIRPIECRNADDVRTLAAETHERMKRRRLPSRPRPVIVEALPEPIAETKPAFPEGAVCHWPRQRDWLFVTEEAPHRITLKSIVRATCEFYGFSRDELFSPRRQGELVRARQVAMFIAKHLTVKSFPDLGRSFGGRDHTTVLHALRRVDALLDTDPMLSDEIESICYAIEREVG